MVDMNIETENMRLRSDNDIKNSPKHKQICLGKQKHTHTAKKRA